MDINATLLGEMLTFAVLVWATMKYIWPPLMQVMQERQQKIAAGLEAAQRGQQALELAQKTSTQQLQEAKSRAIVILDKANQQANNLIEASKSKAQDECAKIFTQAKLDMEQEIDKTKKELRQQTATLVIAATEKILQQKINQTTQQKLIDQLIAEI